MRLAGVGEVSKILGVSKQRVHQLRAADRLPDPVAVLAATPVWDADEMESFAATRVKHSGACCSCVAARNESFSAAPHAQPSLSVTATNDASTTSPIATDTPSPLSERTK